MNDDEVRAGPRVHELRVGVEGMAGRGFDPGDLAEILDAALADWHASPLLTDDSRIWLITGFISDRVGTAEYARRAHTLVQSILATGSVAKAEADLPVMAFVDRHRAAVSGSGENDPPGSEQIRWARDAIRCDEAWAIEPSRGAGILIGHPDTGYTLHPNLGAGALDRRLDKDFISNDDNALDPLVPPDESPWPMPYPGHGTTTASVIAGRGGEEEGIVGVAPRSKVVPLRAVESVVQLFDSDVARAVEHARVSGCHAVSISLGGKGFFGLRTAISRAVDAGLVVIAAAGNNVGIVVAPASYADCLAVAATGPDGQIWPESSRGRAVDVSAPGWGVHVAGYVWQNSSPQARVFRSSGTSYAATHLAGVAALWLAHHGADALRERYGSLVQAAFLHLLRTGGARAPAGWDSALFGAGIVDAAAMLAAPLPAIETIAGHEPLAVESSLVRLAALVGVNTAELEVRLAKQLDLSGDDVHRAVDRFEGELAFHLVENANFRARLLGGAATGRLELASLSGSSPEFLSAFRLDGPDVHTS